MHERPLANCGCQWLSRASKQLSGTKHDEGVWNRQFELSESGELIVERNHPPSRGNIGHLVETGTVYSTGIPDRWCWCCLPKRLVHRNRPSCGSSNPRGYTRACPIWSLSTVCVRMTSELHPNPIPASLRAFLLSSRSCATRLRNAPCVTRMERVYLTPITITESNLFAYQPKHQLQSTRAKRATWLNGAKECIFEFRTVFV
jgi:hypothetical protein